MNPTPSPSMPIGPEGHIVSINGIEMYYEVYGEGPPLVLLHWFTGSSQIWKSFIADFAKQFRLIIPDLRGHGRSADPRNLFSHRQSALDIFALLDHLKINSFKAMGISSGGMVLVHMATQQPERVKSMILVSAVSYLPEQARRIYRERTPESETWNWEFLRQLHVHGDDQIRALLSSFHNGKDNYDDMNFTSPYLSTIMAKTLIVHGDRDFIFPLSIPIEMYTAIPDAYLWIIPNGDHIPILDERAESFTRIALEFLQNE